MTSPYPLAQEPHLSSGLGAWSLHVAHEYGVSGLVDFLVLGQAIMTENIPGGVKASG